MELTDFFLLLRDEGFATWFLFVMLYWIYNWFKLLGLRIQSKIKSNEWGVKPKTPEQLDELNHENNKIAAQIDDYLHNILEDYDVDCARVLQYFNWTYYNSGQHAQYIDCTHEVVNRNVDRWATMFRNIPASIFQPANSPLSNWENIIAIPKVDHNIDKLSLRDATLRQMYKSLWFKSYYAIALRNRYWHLIWKVTILWINKEISLTKNDLSAIQLQTSKIEALLTYKDNSNANPK